MLQSRFGAAEFSMIHLQRPGPKQALHVVGIKLGCLGIGIQGFLGIAQAGDGTEVAIGGRRFFPVFLNPCGLGLSNSLEKWGRLRHVPRRQQAQRLL